MPKPVPKPVPKVPALPSLRTGPVADPTAKMSADSNKEYYVGVLGDIETIKDKWPNIASLDPLPQTGESGFMQLRGFLEPFLTLTYLIECLLILGPVTSLIIIVLSISSG